MSLEWFNTREVSDIGAALADRFASQQLKAAARKKNVAPPDLGDMLQQVLQQVDREVRGLRLNFFKRTKFAHSFKWRLLESGVERDIADEATQRVLVHLSRDQTSLEAHHALADTDRSRFKSARELLARGNGCMTHGVWSKAITIYQDLLKLDPRHPEGLNNLGAALMKIGRYGEAEERFRDATRFHPDYVDAHSNLGELLRSNGQMMEAETWLRRAVKLNPKHTGARSNLGLTLVFLSRLREAEVQFKKALKIAPQNAEALYGMGLMAAIKGRFDEAETKFKLALESKPGMPSAWAAMASLRMMTSSDAAWLERAEQIGASAISPLEEASLRFAIGKYCDDVGDFKRAFQSYKRANELQKTAAASYDRQARTQFVDDLIHVYTRESIDKNAPLGSLSMKPVFVVGMPRSGTSLAEQIIASHPDANGAGELAFWSDAVRDHEIAIRQAILDEATRKKLAEAYLLDLAARSGDSMRIVDKAPVNSDYLGIIHSVFPHARVIYMQRDPIDTCLSCYFQEFSVGLDFSMDLTDLAHYYRQHRRLMEHWRTVLPPGTVLNVPYAELVANQELWTRKIVNFLGLEWDHRCMDFHKTERHVVTASAWQVRQKIYATSVGRWRNYGKFIAPLLGLRD